MVAPMASRSGAVGPHGITIRSANLAVSLQGASTCGGVSISTSVMPFVSQASNASRRSLAVATSMAGVCLPSCTRRFDHLTDVCCGSMSITALRPLPCRSASTAQCKVSVLLPAPPFRASTPIVFIYLNIIKFHKLAPCGRTVLVDLVPDSPPIRTGHDGQRIGDERLGLTSAVLPAWAVSWALTTPRPLCLLAGYLVAGHNVPAWIACSSS